MVARKFRGRGIANMMLEEVERKARLLGYCKLTLDVLENNVAARALYAEFGFTPYGLDPALGLSIVMEKEVSSS